MMIGTGLAVDGAWRVETDEPICRTVSDGPVDMAITVADEPEPRVIEDPATSV